MGIDLLSFEFKNDEVSEPSHLPMSRNQGCYITNTGEPFFPLISPFVLV